MFIPRNNAGSSKAAGLRAATTRVTSMLRERVLGHCVNADAIQLMVTEIGMDVCSAILFLYTINKMCPFYPVHPSTHSNFGSLT